MFSSCRGFLSLFDDRLSLKKEPYNGNELRIDGVYYTKRTYTWTDGSKHTIIVFYTLNRNGVLRYLGASEDFNYYKLKFSKKHFKKNMIGVHFK